MANIAALINCAEVEKQIRDLASTNTSTSASAERGTDLKIGRSSEDWQLIKEEGNEHYKNQPWTEAMNCYTKAIRINPKVATLYSNRALCELQLSKFGLAREDAEDAIDLDPGQVKFYRILSEALVGLSLFKEAIEVCRTGLEIDPRDETLLLRLRDSKALKTDQKIKQHPVFGGSESQKGAEGIENMVKFFIKDVADVFPAEIGQMTASAMANGFRIAEAHKIMTKGKGKISEEQKAMKIFEMTAKQGSAEGLYNLAIFYKDGTAGLARDLMKAKKLFEEAVSQKPYVQVGKKVMPNVGVAEAECTMGILYRDGLGVDKNVELAFKWFLRSAQHGCASAQNNLGIYLLSGKGCSKNLEALVPEICRTWTI